MKLVGESVDDDFSPSGDEVDNDCSGGVDDHLADDWFTDPDRLTVDLEATFEHLVIRDMMTTGVTELLLGGNTTTDDETRPVVISYRPATEVLSEGDGPVLGGHTTEGDDRSAVVISGWEFMLGYGGEDWFAIDEAPAIADMLRSDHGRTVFALSDPTEAGITAIFDGEFDDYREITSFDSPKFQRVLSMVFDAIASYSPDPFGNTDPTATLLTLTCE